MYTLDYGPVRVATVRPETIFGDAAVAVHPNDKRHINLVGKDAVIPLANRSIPIIADDYVDLKTGTGALKVTPGHDPHDYEIGQRHSLPEISVIDATGLMINVPEEFAGLDVQTARQKTVEALQAAGKIVDANPLVHQVAIHDRCGTVIEPLISEQWFLRVKELNQPVIEALEREEVRVFPARFKKVALNWLQQEHDWCISRDSCWWGIRIPVYYKTFHDAGKEAYLIASTEQAAIDYYGAGNYRAETATFDTWFSSGQWPYATLMTTGENDFATYYPTSLMGTAREILHKWVTRMVMFGIYRTGEVPFRHVYLWGLITDEHGKKMSKSKGNVVDPLAITARYGTDALRLAGAISNTAGTDSPMSEKQVEAMRNFCNKLWNIGRFVEEKVNGTLKREELPEPQTAADHWIMTRLHQATRAITKKIDSYQLNEAANLLYHLVWDDFADWYIEASKIGATLPVLAFGLETIIKLAHPFVPFVTETIWQTLGWESNGLLITSKWPEVPTGDAKEAREFEAVKQIVSEVRNLASTLNLAKPVLLYTNSPLLDKHSLLIQQLARLGDVKLIATGQGLKLTQTTEPAWLDVDHKVIRRYADELHVKLQIQETQIKQLKGRLANKAYVANAPKAIVAQTRQQLAEAEALLVTLATEQERFSKT